MVTRIGRSTSLRFKPDFEQLEAAIKAIVPSILEDVPCEFRFVEEGVKEVEAPAVVDGPVLPLLPAVGEKAGDDAEAAAADLAFMEAAIREAMAVSSMKDAADAAAAAAAADPVVDVPGERPAECRHLSRRHTV